MKVSEAETKVCPFIEDAVFTNNEGTNGTSEIPKNIKCITTNCMAWKVIKKGQISKVAVTRSGITYAEHKSELVDSNEGYCQRLGDTK